MNDETNIPITEHSEKKAEFVSYSSRKRKKRDLKTEIEIILREQELFRNEILERMRNQSNYMLIAVTILGALLGYLGHLYELWNTDKVASDLLEQCIRLGTDTSNNSIDILTLPSTITSEKAIFLFLAEPLPKISVLAATIILNSIGALFIYNEKRKELTVQYIYDHLAPRLNFITYLMNGSKRHLYWRKFRNVQQSKKDSKINLGLLFISNYTLTMGASLVLFAAMMFGVHLKTGLLNQEKYFIVFEFLFAIQWLWLFISAIKTFLVRGKSN